MHMNLKTQWGQDIDEVAHECFKTQASLQLTDSIQWNESIFLVPNAWASIHIT